MRSLGLDYRKEVYNGVSPRGQRSGVCTCWCTVFPLNFVCLSQESHQRKDVDGFSGGSSIAHKITMSTTPSVCFSVDGRTSRGVLRGRAGRSTPRGRRRSSRPAGPGRGSGPARPASGWRTPLPSDCFSSKICLFTLLSLRLDGGKSLMANQPPLGVGRWPGLWGTLYLSQKKGKCCSGVRVSRAT